MEFSLYVIGYPTSPIPEDAAERAKRVFEQSALLELMHDYGTEADEAFSLKFSRPPCSET